MSLFPAYSASPPSSPTAVSRVTTNNGTVTGAGLSPPAVISSDPPYSASLSDRLLIDEREVDCETPDLYTDSESIKYKIQKKKSREKCHSDKTRQRKQKKEKNYKKEKHKSKDWVCEEGESFVSRRMKDVFLDEASLSRVDRAFQVDRNRDLDNLAFNSTHYKHAAIYNRRRQQRPLGSTLSKYRIGSHRRQSRYFSRRALRLCSAQHDSCVVFTQLGGNNVSAYGLSVPLAEYIPLKQLNDRTSSSSVCNERGVGEKQSRDDDDWIPETATLRDFNMRLSRRPFDTTLWLQFIAAQSRLLSTASSDSCPTEQQLYERQLAIIDRALTSCPGSRELQLVRLRLLEQTAVEVQQLQMEWRKLITAWPNQIDVWSSYLCFEQHRVGFSVSATLTGFARCFRRMLEFARGSVLSHDPPSDLPGIKLRLLYKMAVMLCECGYTELAVAIYQAQLELNLHRRPLDVVGGGNASSISSFSDQPWHQRLVTFEQFWDARLPRIGEFGARGWRQELSARLRQPLIEADNQQQQLAEDEALRKEEAISAEREQIILDDKTLSINDKWLRIERLREDAQWLPWQRRGFEDECEDIERIVSFETISRFLFPVTSAAGCIQLVKCLTALLEPDYQLLHGPLWPDERPVSSPPPDGTSSNPHQQQLSQIDQHNNDGASIDQMSGGSFCPLPSVYSTSPPPSTPSRCEPGRVQRHEFICRLLEQSWCHLHSDTMSTSTTPSPRHQLQLVYIKQQLWSAAAFNRTLSRRAVKRLLKTERSSVELFSEYARAEATPADVSALLETIVAQSGVTSSSATVRHKLVNCLLSALMKRQQQRSAADCEANSQRLADQARSLLSQQSADVADNHADADGVSCRAWRQLLLMCRSKQQHQRQQQSGASVQRACQVFSEAFSTARRKRMSISQLGSLLLSQYRFLDSVSCVPGLSGASSCRQLLKNTLLSAPSAVVDSNLSLCHIATEVDSSRVSASCSQHNDCNCLSQSSSAASPVRTLLGCYLRLVGTKRFKHFLTGFLCDKCDADGGQSDAITRLCSSPELHRVKRITTRLAKHSPMLRKRPDFWRLTLSTNCVGGDESGAATPLDKNGELLCYRAIQSCPWSKSLYLHLARYSPARAVQLMSRAGVRVRLPLQELQLLLELEPEQLSSEGGGGGEPSRAEVGCISGGGSADITDSVAEHGGAVDVRLEESSGESSESESDSTSGSE